MKHQINRWSGQSDNGRPRSLAKAWILPVSMGLGLLSSLPPALAQFRAAPLHVALADPGLTQPNDHSSEAVPHANVIEPDVAQFQPGSEDGDSGHQPPLSLPHGLMTQPPVQAIAQFTLPHPPTESPQWHQPSLTLAQFSSANPADVVTPRPIGSDTGVSGPTGFDRDGSDASTSNTDFAGNQPWTTAQLFNSALDQLPSADRAALRNGEVLVTQRNGQFVGRVLVNATAANVWPLLTDYNNLARVFPNIESSKLLRSNGNTHVFEQVNVVRFFPVTRRIRVVVAATERYPQQINFSLVEGDVEALQGTWQLDGIAPYSGAEPTQVLITHQVAITPGGGTPRNLFQGIYSDALEDTLAAIKRAAE